MKTKENESQKPEWFTETVSKEVVDKAIAQVDEAVELKGKDAMKNIEGTIALIKSFEGKTLEETYDCAISLVTLLPEKIVEGLAIAMLPKNLKMALSFMAIMGK